jgi:uncharacterized membrane protein
MSISKEDRKRIANAIRSAEAKTSGEIVCVLAQTSTHAAALPVILAAVAVVGRIMLHPQVPGDRKSAANVRFQG